MLEDVADDLETCYEDIPNARAVREAVAEIRRLHSRVHGLEAEAMKAGGERVIEFARRMDAERERDEARGGMIALARENAEYRMALGRILECWPLGVGRFRDAMIGGKEVLERFRTDPEMVSRIREELRTPPRFDVETAPG